jgi:16S rRNA (guanine527-N7)-methyltransferase
MDWILVDHCSLFARTIDCAYNSLHMDATVIRKLLAPFLCGTELSDGQVTRISQYMDLLLKWNARMNLTAVRDPEQILQRHFGESLFVASLIEIHCPSAKTLADVGSGAGFPGIPIKIAAQALEVTLIEAHYKKAVFLKEVIRALELSGTYVASDRASNLSAKFDVATLRAVESFTKILPEASRLIADRGSIVLFIGSNQVAAASSLLPGFRWKQQASIPRSERRVVLFGTRES